MMHSKNYAEVRIAPIIDGVPSNSDSDEVLDVVNPSSGQLLRTISVGSDADIDRAVSAARRAFDEERWMSVKPSTRKKILNRFAENIAQHAQTLDELDAVEMGKPINLCFAGASSAAEVVRFYAEAVDKVMGDVYCSDSSSFVAQMRVPRGVVGAIVPWNFPTFNAVLKVSPSLAAGNCIVLKPSELSSASAIVLAHLALDAGLPPGVFNVVPGLGGTVGKALGLHQDVDMLAFTGSTLVGRKMLQYSAQSNMKVVAVECGGKSPQIVFPDGVDLDAASTGIARLLLTNQGQICSVGSRLLVHRSIQADMVDKISAQFRKIVAGDALNPSTTFGPLASAAQLTGVINYIRSGETDGAQLVFGGKRMLTESGGYFVEPTIFNDVPLNARIAQEEIFGPVLAVIPFNDETDAVRIANSTIFGLIAYVWTADLSRGMRMAKAMRSSVVINSCAPTGEGAGYAFSAEPNRQSGIGTESGLAGMESYMRRHLVWFNHA
jgi:acyl-CoA reductase-like NAD-dependent aldehyde dehydrogenase